MKFRNSLSTPDQDIALVLKMAAAVIEQLERSNDAAREPFVRFMAEEFLRLPWHWELDEGRLVFRCKCWQEENERKYPETHGYPPASELFGEQS